MVADNLGEMLLYGVEAGATLEPTVWSELAASLTYTWGEMERPDGKREPAELVPPLPRGRSGPSSTYIPTSPSTPRCASPEPSGAFPTRTRPGLTARLRVENLLDRGYREHGSGIDAPGVNAIVSLDALF